MMVNVHNFKRDELNRIFSQAKNFEYTSKPNFCSSNRLRTPLGKWDKYRSCFIYEKNIQRGIEFWDKYSDTLAKAEAKYGVPAEYIVGIIGVETAYGTNFGRYKVIDVLTTKSMLGYRRADFYRDELEKFLLLARQSGFVPTELMGSTSGALGYGQFMPSSYIRFGVDFNNDGFVDLWECRRMPIGRCRQIILSKNWVGTPYDFPRGRVRGQEFGGPRIWNKNLKPGV